jgi:isoleucyl-tRNA synthetase
MTANNKRGENKVEYKDTLHLPKTEFPMKANLANKEPTIIKFWQDLNLYELMQQQRQGCQKFILNDGPPYANGNIHIGHAVNKILKDIIIKSKHLSGFAAPYIPGWDCHGLPIEIQVEKTVGKPGDKIDAKTFRKHCRDFANKYIDLQRNSFIRLGVFGDWYKPYITMDYQFEADVIRTLSKIIANGHVIKGDKPVHWCINCGSALAEAEVEYDDKISPSIDVAFKAHNNDKLVQCFQQTTNIGTGDIYVVIWTTTPWTLPANQAVVVHPKLTYVLLHLNNKRFIIAQDLLELFKQRVPEFNECKILGSCIGAALEQQQLQHPMYDRIVPIILGEHVTTDAGTGCVHTAPAHGYDDYLICKKYNLPMVTNPVENNGCFNTNVAHVGGMNVFKANEVIIKLLEQKQTLLSKDQIEHKYPHCWRHKTPLIFRATSQWFISMELNGLRKQTLTSIKQVEWIPNWGQARIETMINNRPDWCISRQRTWGTPIALFVHKETGKIHPNSIALMEEVAKLVEKHGIDAWYDLDQTTLLGKETAYYDKVLDTLDVWFDSGAVHMCVAARRKELDPNVDLYLEGSDQHRGWFQTSLLSSVAVHGHAPYKQVLTHGFAVDASGRKMSKSLGNVVVPEQVIKTLGADILRLWVAATDYSGELAVSDEILKRTSDTYRRIRNTSRFLLANLHDFDPAINSITFNNMLALDQWIVDRTWQLQQIILTAYEKYQFHIIAQKIHSFCVDDLGSFYLDIIKDRQYTGKKDGVPRRSAQTAIYYIAEALVRWIAPILSFTAEEIWQELPGTRAKSVFLSD